MTKRSPSPHDGGLSSPDGSSVRSKCRFFRYCSRRSRHDPFGIGLFLVSVLFMRRFSSSAPHTSYLVPHNSFHGSYRGRLRDLQGIVRAPATDLPPPIPLVRRCDRSQFAEPISSEESPTLPP